MHQITYGYTENEMNAIYIDGKKATEWQEGDDTSRVFNDLAVYLQDEMKLKISFEVEELPDTDGAAMPDNI